jgi:hypothetical protein
MPGGTQQTTTNTTSKPYPGSTKLIDQGLADAYKLYTSGLGSQVDTSSHVIPFSKQDTQAYGNLTGIANANSGAKGLQGNLQDIINNGGFNGYQSGALGNMQQQLKGLGHNGLTDGQDGVLNRFQNQLQRLGGNGLTGAQDRVLQNYQQLANSSYNPNANPGAKGVLNASIRDATDAVNLNAASAGRYGSGVHEGVLAQKIGDLSSNFRYNDFNNWLGRHDAANQNAASLSQQGLGNVQGFGGAINALGQQGFQNRQGLSSSLFNAGQAGLGNMTNAYQGLQAPEQTRLGVGQADDQKYADLINDRTRIFNAQQNAPWEAIQKLIGVAGLNGQYKDTSGVTVAPGPNPFLQGLGGISTGVGLLGQLGII